MVQWLRQKRQIHSGQQALQQKLAIGNQQQHEGPEQHEMVESIRPRQNPLLGKGIIEHTQQTTERIVKAIFGDADGYQLQPLIAAEHEGEYRNSKYGRKNSLM